MKTPTYNLEPNYFKVCWHTKPPIDTCPTLPGVDRFVMRIDSIDCHFDKYNLIAERPHRLQRRQLDELY